MKARKKILFCSAIISFVTIIGALAIFIATSTNIGIVINSAPDMHREVEIIIDDVRAGKTTLTKDQQADKMAAILELDKSSIALVSGLKRVLYILSGLLSFLGLVIVFQSLYFNGVLKKHEKNA